MERRPRIIVIARDIEHGLVFQRIHINLKLLRDRYDIRAYSIDNLPLSALHYADAIIIPHPYTMTELQIIAKARSQFGVKVIVDIDDLLTELPTDHEFYAGLMKNHVAEILQNADHVVYSTNYIASKYGHLTSRYTVIPNSVDPTRYYFSGLPEPHKNAFIYGWTGSQFHKADQYIFVDAMKKILSEDQAVRGWFHLVCPDSLFREFGTQIIYEPNPVGHLDYALFSKSYPFNVCLVGLDDNEFNNAKSDLRLIEMGILGIPIIASPRSDFLQHRPKGICYYAEDNSSEYMSWYDAMRTAKDDPDTLKTMGKMAKEYVLAERTNKQTSEMWAKVIDRIVA